MPMQRAALRVLGIVRICCASVACSPRSKCHPTSIAHRGTSCCWRLAGKPTCSAYYFFMVVVIIRYETTAAARWALLFIVRTFFNDAFTVAVWTSFHTCLMWS